MDISNSGAITSVIGIASGVGGLYYLGLKIIDKLHKIKKAETDRILDECKELDLVVKTKLESKINLLESQLHNLEANVAKDLTNLKDNHAIELRNLSERIELLRVDLNSQHTHIINLLTKLIP